VDTAEAARCGSRSEILAEPSDPTIKRLFAVSSNRCAFPSCSEPLVEGQTVVGEVCHIKSARKGHPRHDPDQTEEERNGFDNLILLCRKHHKIIDTEVVGYPPALLTEMKKAHEAHSQKRFTISDEMVHRLAELLSRPPLTPSAPEPARTQDDRTEIMLLDAARQTYSETRNDPAVAHAEMSNATPDEVLKWYCVWLAQHMQLYGARRPSTKIEPVSIDNPTKDFDLKDGTLTLRERYGSAAWENLRVKFDELPAVIKDLKGYGK
jgi:hypothetical protein